MTKLQGVILLAIAVSCSECRADQFGCRPDEVPEMSERVGSVVRTVVAAIQRSDGPAISRLIARRGLTIADGIIDRNQLLSEIESPKSPLHEFLFDTGALQESVNAKPPALSLQEFAATASGLVIKSKFRCDLGAPHAYVTISAKNLRNTFALVLVLESKGWRVVCFEDFGC